MRLSQILSNTVVALATIGLLLPNVGLAANPVPAATSVRDVALQAGGALNGQVISAQGAVQPRVRVSIQQNGQQIAQVLTDEQGRFAATGLKGGIYLVATDGTQGVVRAWAPQTAPPSATNGLLLVPQGDVVNGSLNPMGLGVLLVGAIITGVVIAATDDAKMPSS